MGREFCVGDKVKVVEIGTSTFKEDDIGKIGKITMAYSQYSFRIILDDYPNSGGWASYGDVELVEAYDGNTPTKAEPLQTAPEIRAIIPDPETMKRLMVANNPVYAPEVKKETWQVGDKVRVKDINDKVWGDREEPISYMCGNIYAIEGIDNDGSYNLEGAFYLQDELEFVCSKGIELSIDSPEDSLELKVGETWLTLEGDPTPEEEIEWLKTQDKITEQEEKPQDEFTAPDHKGYFIFVSSGSKPKHIHKTYEEALREAHRLANQKENIGAKVYILAVLGAVQGTIEVNEVEL